ncbi:MAG: nucleotidyltransferase family protein [Rhodospirillales bacterium]|nr:nucleotidyltransferase family protein [Rhodospirillales bacterium]MCB9995269.1 nucleotidyltransferase family protein [Rhodospirillales bacterium]
MDPNTALNILQQNPAIVETIHACFDYGLPHYYLAGGAITQTIWNHIGGKPLMQGIKDLDIVYFAENETGDTERTHENQLCHDLKNKYVIDVKNQAFVHQWYPDKFGAVIPPYKNTEDAISSWLPAFAIGLRLQDNGEYDLFCPFGLEDAFSMVIRPNKRVMPQSAYTQMASSFGQRWPDVTIIEW